MFSIFGVQERDLSEVSSSTIKFLEEGGPGCMFEGGFLKDEDFITGISEFEQDNGVPLGLADVQEEVWFDVV